MEIKRLQAPLELKEATDAGYFEGYAAVYGNIDSGNDVIESGAFKKMKLTRDGKMRVLAYHDTRRIVGLSDVESDSKGLLVKGNINLNIPYARDVYELMKSGAIDSMSIGYSTIEADFKEKDGDYIRIIKEAELWEVSVLPFGMNEEAGIIDVKTDKRMFEAALRERMGLSQKEAKHVTQVYFSGRDGHEEGTEMALDLKGINNLLDKYL